MTKPNTFNHSNYVDTIKWCEDVLQESEQSIEKLTKDFVGQQKALEHWFQSTIGRSLLASQRLRINRLIEHCYGVHQAELSISHRIPVGNASGLGHRFFVVPTIEADMPENTIVCNTTELALESGSADMVIMHHALDFSPDPHQTLREAARVLKPNGNIALVGFNPNSLWGLMRLIRRNKAGLWGNRFISSHRVADWLNLLDFKIATTRYYFYAPPINHHAIPRRFSWLESVLNSKVPLGAYYVIMAQKQEGAFISRSRNWRKKAPVIGLTVANRTNSLSKNEHKN